MKMRKLVVMQQSLGSLGEDRVLERILSHVDPGDHVSVGPGDDAAVSTLPGPTVTTTDMLVEESDFLREWLDPYRLGGKAAAQNLSDLYAMGATPHGLLMSLSAPNDTPIDVIEEFTRGLNDEAQRAGAAIIGGDLSTGGLITVAITAIGYLRTEPILRSGARPHDGVFLAGTVGHAAAGLDLLFAGHRLGNSETDPFIETQLAPRPDYTTAARLPGWANAGIDASDGLSGDLGKVARKSGVDIHLDPEAIAGLAKQVLPAAHILGDPDRALKWVLHGGEDHGYLVTGPADTAPVGLTRIGTCVTGTGRLTLDGKDIQPGAFTHFSEAQ